MSVIQIKTYIGSRTIISFRSMKFRHSIVTRFALFFTGLIIFSVLLTGYLVFRKAAGVIVAYSQERIMYTSDLAEQSFYALLNEVSNDIAVIAASPTLRNYVNDPRGGNAADIDNLFRITLENKASYFQIRFIGVADQGKEVIRFDKSNGRVFKSDTLQQKGDLDYFKETVQIKKGEFYFSKINLNEEYGVISEPPTPTVRAASPIFDSEDRPVGVLVINVDLGKLYGTFGRISGSESQLNIIDAEGQYLYSPETFKQFSEQTHKGFNFYTDFKIDAGAATSQKQHFGQLEGSKGSTYMGAVKELSYFHGVRKVYLISYIEQNILLKSARSVRADSLRTLLWICLFSILMSWLFANLFSRKINQVTKAISNYDKGVTDHIDLPTDRNDEIGTLAKSFTKMKAKIDGNVEKLNSALEKEQHAKKQRDEFLQNMSHEMRTPLNTILGLTQLLYRQSPSETQLPILHSLERSTNNLAGLVYDVLDHQKLLERKVQLVKRPTDIAELLRDIHSSYEFEALQKGLSFTLNLDKKLDGPYFETDPLRLSQIVTNLVVNAIKYTQKGNIDLIADIGSGNVPVLALKVKDTGIGILPENIAKINERFFREEEDLSGRYGGYGLGLSIVRQLTELFKGTLKAVSKKGEGSEFQVTLPLLPSAVLKIKDSVSARQHVLPRLENTYRILYIEDDAPTLELMKYILDDEKIVLHHTDTLDDLLERITMTSPDLLISDLMLADKNLVSLIKKWVKTKKITCPLILVSALEPKSMAQISPLYFQKPFDTQHFKDSVYRILGTNEFKAPDFSNVYSNYDNNPAKVGKVLRLLGEEFETYLKRIENAAVTKDQKEWKAILHKLIAHINTLGLTDLKHLLPEKVADFKSEDLNVIRNIFAYCSCCIRCEEHLNSKARFF